MLNIWIYFAFILSGSADIFININMDYFPIEKEIKVYDQPISITNCSFLRIVGNSVSLLVESNLINTVCVSNNNVTFYIFIYYTNIVSAIVTIENKNYSLDDIKNISQNGIILTIQAEYICFVICEKTSNDFCKYRSVDQKATDRSVYSACDKRVDQDPCLTVITFDKTISYNTPIIGTSIIVKNSTRKDYYEAPVNCHNGGKKIEGADKCVCKDSDAFIKHGPQCEALQQKLSETQYLYVLPNSNNFEIEFALFSPAHNKKTKIMEIKHMFVYSINGKMHELQSEIKNITIEYPLDTESKWRDVLLIISSSQIIFKINEKEEVLIGDLKDKLLLDTKPLIIFEEKPKTDPPTLCMSNLKVDSRIVDLYTPVYKDCVEGQCKNCDQSCYFIPFKSDANVECICKAGFQKPGDCTKSAKQIQNNQMISKDKINQNMMEAILRFRTRSNQGTLITFIMSQPPNFEINIEISPKGILEQIKNGSRLFLEQFQLSSVSDGQWHKLQIKITNYLSEMIVDENLKYSRKEWFNKSILAASDIPKVSEIKFGPLSNTMQNNSNLTTCFDTFVIIDNANKFVQIPNLFDAFDEGCYSGTNCSSIICKQYERCEDQWQNSACLCQQDFTNINDKCTFNKCIQNPCQNNGTCGYDNSIKDLHCTCNNPYSGKYCEENQKDHLYSWWIYLIIAFILFILLTAIAVSIILCYCFCTSRKKRRRLIDISKVYENTVAYSDQAGEADYSGPPIDLELIKKFMNFNKPTSIDLTENKRKLEIYNEDLLIDQALEYGYEGQMSDSLSISSLGSGSTNEELDICPINNSKENFGFLKALYK